MESHFKLLGLSRGCDEAALKKAYHAKALALHPDRNPTGAEQFKRVNEAYEALCTHFRRGGGRDGISTQAGAASARAGKPTAGWEGTFFAYTTHYTNAGSGFQYARQSQFREESPHLFTEEELFGCSPGGFTYERRDKRGRTRTNPGANGDNINTGDGRSRNSNTDNMCNKGMAGDANFNTSRMYEEADERWRRAHGDRVPVSGYSSHGGASGMSSRTHQQQRESRFQQPKPTPSSSSLADDVTGGMEGCSNNAGAKGRSSSNNNNNSSNNGRSNRYTANDVGRREGDKGYPSEGFGSDNNSSSSSSFMKNSPLDDVLNEFETRQTLNEIRREWERLKKDTDRKMPGSSSSPNDIPCRKWGGGADAYEDYVAHQKPVGAREDDAYRQQRHEQQRLNETHMRGLLEEKLKLKKVLFTQRYTPDPADVALMSDSEVFVLCELLREVGKRMEGVMNGRLTKGLCSRCSSAAKMQGSSVFTCGHTSVCSDCAPTSSTCPVCAATRR